MEENSPLKLDNQLCFPLYVCSKEIVKRYKPLLDRIDLTYTQYITMMVMWEKECISVKELGEMLYLDSGTLTPVLKTLEKKGFVSRERSKEDERVLIVTITTKGKELYEKALSIPQEIGKCVHLTSQESIELYRLLYKVLEEF